MLPDRAPDDDQVLGDDEQAAAHHRAALAFEERIGPTPLAARTRRALAEGGR